MRTLLDDTETSDDERFRVPSTQQDSGVARINHGALQCRYSSVVFAPARRRARPQQFVTSLLQPSRFIAAFRISSGVGGKFGEITLPTYW